MEWFVSKSKENFKAVGRVCVWLVEKRKETFQLSKRDQEMNWHELDSFTSIEEAQSVAEKGEAEFNKNHPEAVAPKDIDKLKRLNKKN